MKKVSLMKKMGVMLLASLFLGACTTPGESVIADPSLQLLELQDTLQFSVLGKAERSVLTLSANMDWELSVETAHPAVNWVNVDKTGGNRGKSYISFTVEPNPYTFPRECDIVIRGKGAYAGKVVRVHLVQEGSVVSIPELETDPVTVIEAATTGDEGDIRVLRATRPWKVEVLEGAAWLTLDKNEGGVVNVDPNKVVEDDALLVHWTAAEFEGADPREARLKFSIENPNPDDPTPSYSRELVIRQAPVSLTLVSVSPEPIVVHQEGTDRTPASFTFDVNRSWVAAVTDPVGADWISLSATEGEDGLAQKVDLNLLPNPNVAVREATITVTAGTATFSVKVTQQGAGINVPPYSADECTFPAKASFLEFANITVDNGEPWTATTDVDWLTLDFGEGYDSSLPVGDGYNDVLKATAKANPKPASRKATITIKSGEMTAFFEVVQSAARLGVTSVNEVGVLTGDEITGYVYKIESDGNQPITLDVMPTNELPWDIKMGGPTTDWVVPGLVNLQGHDMTKPFQIHFTFLPNPKDEAREAIVTFYTGTPDSPDMTVTLKIIQKATVLTIDQTTVNFPPKGSYQSMDELQPELAAKSVVVSTDNSLPITYQGPVVTGSDPAEEAQWLTLTQTAQGFDLLCDRNPGETGRSATITVLNGDIKKEVVVTQDPAGSLSLAESDVILYAPSGESYDVIVINYSDNNIEPVYDVTYSQGSGWLDVALTKLSNTTNEYKVHLTTLTPNTTLTDNEAEVKISCGDVKAVLKVRQTKMLFSLTPKLGSPYESFDITKLEQELENYPVDYLFNHIINNGDFVTTNIPEVPWTVVEKAGSNTDPDKAWFHFAKESQALFKFNVLQFNDFVDENGVPAERSVVLTFTQGEQSHDLTFTQKAGDITLQRADAIALDAYAYTDIMWRASASAHAVAVNGVYAGQNGTQLNHFVLPRDYQVEVIEGAEWLTLTYERDTKYPDYGAIRFNALANPTDKERTGKMKVSYGRMSTTLGVVQKAAELVLATTSMSSTSEVAGPDRKIQLRKDGTPLNEMNAGDHFYLTGSNLLGLTVASFDAPAADWFKTAVVPSTLNVPQVDPNAYWPGMDLPGYMNGDIKVNDGTNLENLDAATLLVYDILPNPREQERVHKMRIVLGDANGEHIEFPVTFSQPGATLTVVNMMELQDPKAHSSYQLTAPVTTCTGADWTVDAEWLTPGTSWFKFSRDNNGNVNLADVEYNPTDQAREMNLVFTSGAIVKRTRVVQPAAEIRLNQTVIDFAPGGEANHTVELVTTTNGKDWEVVVPAEVDWLEATKGQHGKLAFSNVSENNTGKERSAVLTITCGELTAQLTVRQEPMGADFSLDTAFETLVNTQMPANQYVSILPICKDDFADWSVGSYDDTWVTVVKEGNKLIVTKLLANPTFNVRSVTIPIEYAGTSLGFTLQQRGGEIKFLTNNATSLMAVLNGGNNAGVNFKLTSGVLGNANDFSFLSSFEPDNVTIAVQDKEDEEWLTPYLLNGADPGSKEVWVNVKANATGKVRSAVLVITSGEMTREINVTQNPATINLSIWEKIYSGEAHAELIENFTISSEDPNWVVDASTVDWMTVTRVGDQVKITLTQNNTGAERTALVVIRNSGRTEAQTLRIVQVAL